MTRRQLANLIVQRLDGSLDHKTRIAWQILSDLESAGVVLPRQIHSDPRLVANFEGSQKSVKRAQDFINARNEER